MQQSKPITITAPLLEGRDDQIIEFVSQPHINTSEAIRQGLALYIAHLNHIDSLVDINADILAALGRIEKALSGAGRTAAQGPPDNPKPPRSDNPFFNASP